MLYKSNHPIACFDRYINHLRKVERIEQKYIQSYGVIHFFMKVIYVLYYEKLMRMGQRYNLDIRLHSCGEGLKIWHTAGGVVINANARIGRNLTLHGNNCIGNDGIRSNEAPIMGDDIHMGFGSCVLGGVTIADGIWIAAGAVVISSFYEPNIIIGGVPAKKIGLLKFDRNA